MPSELRRPLVAGNWKMNGLRSRVADLLEIARGAGELPHADILVCPPATLIMQFAAAVRDAPVRIGAQDCHSEPSGAYTGDIAAEMLKDAGASAVILGHSERRLHHGETDADVRAKVLAARRADLLAIVCVGETRAEREGGSALAVVGTQLDGSLPEGMPRETLVVAYEPVWAIGSGLTPTSDDIAEMHAFIRRRVTSRFGESMQQTRILYGGSVKASNAGELMRIPDVDGALVGGASLNAREFLAIAAAYR